MRGKTKKSCPICRRIAGKRFYKRGVLAVTLFDEYPVSDGHILVVPVRHEANFFILSPEEQGAILDLLNDRAAYFKLLYGIGWPGGEIDGFNIGINVGEAVGQTVGHACVHLIPRHKGGAAGPRGDMRRAMPFQGLAYFLRKAKYRK